MTPAIPLRRLLKQSEATALLAEFETLLPGGNLALVGPDGRVHAGSEDWNPAELERLWARAIAGGSLRFGRAILQPVFVGSQLAAMLVARPSLDPDRRVPAEHVLRCLDVTLTLFLKRALDVRDVVSETLDRYREINLLYRIGETIGGCLDASEIPNLVLREVQRIIRADAGIVVLPAGASTRSYDDVGIKGSFGATDHVRALHAACHEAIGQASETNQPSIVTIECSPEASGAGMGTILCAPIKTQGVTWGAIILGRSAGQPEFTAADGKLAMALAHQAAIAMETARLHREELKQQRLEEELAIGRQIQLSLLPQSYPVIPGWEFATVYEPARQVGGDFYDLFPLPGVPDHLSLVVADVTGKGIPAALLMAFSRTIIRSESMDGCGPARILRQANRAIVHDIRSSLFLSVCCATLDTRSGSLVYASGGHDPPLWFQAETGGTQWLSARGFVLGAFPEVEPEECAIDLGPGDLLVFYTDGVTEARSPSRDLFGEDRLRATVEAHARGGARRTQQALVGELEAFKAGTPQSDDLTLLIVSRHV
jgi:serine phosphatase RsbU (regulator of sigma subunit)